MSTLDPDHSWVPAMGPEALRAWALWNALLPELSTANRPKVEDTDRIYKLADEVRKAAHEDHLRRHPDAG